MHMSCMCAQNKEVGGHVLTSCIFLRKPAGCLGLMIKQVWPMLCVFEKDRPGWAPHTSRWSTECGQRGAAWGASCMGASFV